MTSDPNGGGMVDDPVWGRTAWIRAGGIAGDKAMRSAQLEYIARRLEMLFLFLLPVAAFPVIGMIIQAATTVVPQADLFREYGPLGVLAGWLMLKDYRQERRNDKRDREQSEHMASIVSVLHGMKDRPCLYELEMGQLDQPRRVKRDEE